MNKGKRCYMKKIMICSPFSHSKQGRKWRFFYICSFEPCKNPDSMKFRRKRMTKLKKSHIVPHQSTNSREKQQVVSALSAWFSRRPSPLKKITFIFKINDRLSDKKIIYFNSYSTFLRTKEKQQFQLLSSRSKPRVYHAV